MQAVQQCKDAEADADRRVKAAIAEAREQANSAAAATAAQVRPNALICQCIDNTLKSCCVMSLKQLSSATAARVRQNALTCIEHALWDAV